MPSSWRVKMLSWQQMMTLPSCKRFAVEKGYWQDPYITLLVPKGRAGHAPEINKGYYARVTSIRVLIQKFLQVILPLRCLLEIICAWKRCFWSCLLVFKERKTKKTPPPPPRPPVSLTSCCECDRCIKSEFLFHCHDGSLLYPTLTLPEHSRNCPTIPSFSSTRE